MKKSATEVKTENTHIYAHNTHLVGLGLLLARPREEDGDVLLGLDLQMVHPDHRDQRRGTNCGHVLVLIFISEGYLSDIFFLKHDSSILRQLSNPVSGSWKSQAS